MSTALDLDASSSLLSTGCPVLDALLCGGIPPGVTELCGEAGAGKTQLLLQLALQAQLPPALGGAGARVVYISTEGAVPTRRLQQMASELEAACAARAAATAEAIATEAAATQATLDVSAAATAEADTPRAAKEADAAAADAGPMHGPPPPPLSPPPLKASSVTTSSAAVASAVAFSSACAGIRASALVRGVLVRSVHTAGELETAVCTDLLRLMRESNIGSSLNDSSSSSSKSTGAPDAEKDAAAGAGASTSAPARMPGRRIGLVIIDSVTAPFRYDFSLDGGAAHGNTHVPSHAQAQAAAVDADTDTGAGAGASADTDTTAAAAGAGAHFRRIEAVARLGSALRALSRAFNVPIVVSNQVADAFDAHPQQHGAGLGACAAPLHAAPFHGAGWHPRPARAPMPCHLCAEDKTFATVAVGAAATRAVVPSLGLSWGVHLTARLALARGRAAAGAAHVSAAVVAAARAADGDLSMDAHAGDGRGASGRRPWLSPVRSDGGAGTEAGAVRARTLQVLFAPHAPPRAPVRLVITAEGVRGTV